MTESTYPLVKDVRRAAAGVRVAVEAAMAGDAPLAQCRECRRDFHFLVATGLIATTEELCPTCEPEGGVETGHSIELAGLARLVFDRRGLLAVARDVAATRRCSMPEAEQYMEHVEASQDGFKRWLALAKQTTLDPAEAWRTAFLVWRQGIAAVAVTSPLAAQMARLRATADPKAVKRVVVKLRGKVLYDGPVNEEAGQVLRKGEDEHGRHLFVTLHHNDGTKTHRRGERETAPEHRFDDAALGGVRAMLAGASTPLESFTWGDKQAPR